jgi:hypothetical protein
MVDEDGVRTAVHLDPLTFEEVRWGKRVAAVRVSLPRVDSDALAELLADAWERRAPARLVGPRRR